MKFLINLILILIIFSCSSQKATLETKKTLHLQQDGQYDSEFPTQPTSPFLDKIIKSLKLISTMTFYRAYQFELKDWVLKTDLKKAGILKKAKKEYIFQRPASGTATLISQIDKELLFLTCNHIVNHEDTLFSYYSKMGRPKEASPFIHTVSFKAKENLNIVGLPASEPPVLITFDKKNDLAIVGTKLIKLPKFPLPVLNIPFGQAKNLHWGTFIYLLAFPQGKLMITSSVVSQPNRDDGHNFLFNTSLTRGISGGLILALKDGVPNFEIVGIASALGAQNRYYLTPDPNKVDWLFDTNKPYTGDIFVEQGIKNNSGIVFAVSVENIIRFIKKSKPSIEAHGFTFPDFQFSKRP